MARCSGHPAGRAGPLLRWKLSHHLGIRAGCYALHHRFNHFAVDDRRLADLEEVAGRGRDGTSKDQSVDALSDRCLVYGSDWLRRPLAADKWRRRSHLWLPADDYSDADDRNDFCDVAG